MASIVRMVCHTVIGDLAYLGGGTEGGSLDWERYSNHLNLAKWLLDDTDAHIGLSDAIGEYMNALEAALETVAVSAFVRIENNCLGAFR